MKIPAKSSRRSRELAFLRRILQAVATDDHAAAMRSIIRETTEATHTQVCSLYLWDEHEERLVLSATNGLTPDAVDDLKLALGEGVTGWVAQQREPAAILNVANDARFIWIPNVDERRFTSMLSVPVILRERLLGVLNVQTEAKHRFSKGEIAFLQAIAAHLAGIVQIGGLERQLQLSQALRASEERFSRIVGIAREGVVTMAPDGAVTYANRQLCDMLGYSADELGALRVDDFLGDLTASELLRAVERPPDSMTDQDDIRLRRKNGSTLWTIASGNSGLDAGGAPREALIMFTDVSERKRAEAALKQQALYDALTGLPNRTLFEDRVGQALRSARRDRRPFSILLLDLDRFKEVNDGLGHHTGDRLLQQVGPRLTSALRESDTVARLGGDEFAAVLPATGLNDAEVASGKILQGLEEPFQIDGHSLQLGASIGIVGFPEHGEDGDTLMRRADLAMYVAKRDRGSYAIYQAEHEEQASDRLTLSADLRGALRSNQLELHYQPKINVHTAAVTGVEALARWSHPERGMVPPDVFIPIAEQTGLIGSLSDWVLRTALQQSLAWATEGLQLSVAINLSMRDVQDLRLPDQVKRALDQVSVDPRFLKLELTESMLMVEPERTLQVLHRLDKMGVSLSIDDFGTGFSSLARLATLPVREVKVDRAFVARMMISESSSLIVRSTIDLAHNLGLTVVAEGVEQEETLRHLENLGCDEAQGYWISRPMPASNVIEWMSARASEPVLAQPVL